MTNQIVTLIRSYSGFVNVPDSFAVCEHGYEDAVDEYTETTAKYVLPNGYRVATDNRGEQSIYDPRNQHCEIVEHKSTGRPQLISVGKGGVNPLMPVLARHSETATA